MKNQAGVSVVEIIVSMVVLSFVLLALTNLSVASAQGHSMAKGKDLGNLIAREKLIELKNPGSVPLNGTDMVLRDGVNFTRIWELTGSNPVLATVLVQWNSGAVTKTTEAAGYIEETSACESIENNTPPNGFSFRTADGSEIFTADTVTVPYGTKENRYLGTVLIEDNNISQGDIILVTLAPDEADNKYFTISGDSIKTAGIMDSEDVTYWLRITATDCAGNSIVKKIFVYVEAVKEKPLVKNPYNVNLKENETAVTALKPEMADKDYSTPKNISWTMVSSTEIFDIINSNKLVVTNPEGLDFEENSSQQQHAIFVKASRDGADTVFQVEVTLKDINEPATAITLSNTTIPSDAQLGDLVGKLTVEDPDVYATNSNWNIHTIIGSSSSFKVENGSIVVNSGFSLSEGATEQITVTATDLENTHSVQETFTISVTAGSNNSLTCSDYPNWISGKTYTRLGRQVHYNSKVWQNGSVGNSATPPSGDWIEVGGCQ